MIFVLSLTCGIRAQTFFIELKIRAFLAVAFRGEVFLMSYIVTSSGAGLHPCSSVAQCFFAALDVSGIIKPDGGSPASPKHSLGK